MSVALIKEINEQVDSAVNSEMMTLERRISSAQSEIASLSRQETDYRQAKSKYLSQKVEADTWLKKNQTKKIIGYCLWGLCFLSFVSGGAGGVILGILCGIYGIILGLRDIIYSDIKSDKYGAMNKMRDADSRISQVDRSISETKSRNRDCEILISDCQKELNNGRDYFRNRKLAHTLDEENRKKLHQIEEDAKEALTTYMVDEALYSYRFLRSIFPENRLYKRLEQIGSDINDIITRTSPKAPLSKNEIENDSADCYIELLWKTILSDSLQYFELVVIMEPFIRLSENGYISIDFLAGLAYIDTKYGKKMVEKLCPNYTVYLKRFLDESNGEKLNNMASFSAWCGNKDMEKQFLEASIQRNMLR